MQRYINRYIQSWIFHFSQIVWHARWNFHDNCDQKTKRNLICIKIKSRVCVYHPMVKESIFLKPRLTRASSFPERTNWEARENRVSNRFLSPLVASRIGHPSSKLGPRLLLDTATRCGEEGKRETSLREEATSHRGLFTREFNLCALLYSNEQVCRVQSRNTKKTSNVVPAIPLRRYIYSPLSKSVLSRPRVVFAEEIVSRMARFQFFLPNYSSLPTSVRIPFSFEYSGSTFTFV